MFQSSNCQFHIMILQKANFWQCLKSGAAEKYKIGWTCFSSCVSRKEAQTNSTKFEEWQIYQGKKFSNGCLCILSDSQGKRYQGWLSYTAISIYTSTVLLLPFFCLLFHGKGIMKWIQIMNQRILEGYLFFYIFYMQPRIKVMI